LLQLPRSGDWLSCGDWLSNAAWLLGSAGWLGSAWLGAARFLLCVTGWLAGAGAAWLSRPSCCLHQQQFMDKRVISCVLVNIREKGEQANKL